ncbi:hypothetical protein SK128_026441 [Halocaridina rubra]|uniref:Uncharacterized protein n=1 Tax=Halocaridina rubra TaxID=373956 RepID=A0AAN9A1C2_HALRR
MGTPTLLNSTPAISTSAPSQIDSVSPISSVSNNSILIVKNDRETTRISPSPMQVSPAPSPSPSSKVVSVGDSSTPPIQEQNIHSTASVEQSPEKEADDQPRFIPGTAALCSNCGYTSDDLNQCQRCNVKLSASAKKISSSTVNAVLKSKPSSVPAAVGRGASIISTQFYKQEFHGKTGGGLKKGLEKKTLASPAQKPKGKGRGRGRAFEEPEIVSISSDEEDDERPPSLGSTSGMRVSEGVLPSRFHRITNKEPIITYEMENFDDFEDEDSRGAVSESFK